jgi:hypothetical protein
MYINLVRVSVEICTTGIFRQKRLTPCKGLLGWIFSWVLTWIAFAAFATPATVMEELYILPRLILFGS